MRKYLWSLIATVFQNDRLFKVIGPLQAVTYTLKVVVSKKWHDIDTLLIHTTNRKFIWPVYFCHFQ